LKACEEKFKRHKNFTVVDVFSGAGGLSLGFKMAGFKIAVAVDKDEDVAQTYTYNNPEVKFLLRSVEETDADDILDATEDKGFNSIDVLVGGPPCQGFSSANRRTNGADNPESKCLWEFMRLLEELRPTAFLMENVIGIRSIDKGLVLKEIIGKAKKLGYKPKCEVLNAAEFGVPQYRRRNFIFGNLLGREYAPVLIRDPPLVSVREAMNDLPFLPDGGGGAEVTNYEVQPQTRYQKLMRRGSKKLYNHITTKSGKRDKKVIERFKWIPQGERLRNTWPKLPKELKDGFNCIKNIHNNIYRRLSWEAPAPTIVHVRKAVLIHPLQNRLLSVREAARLQSFLDRYRFFGGITKEYQQVADAVPPLLAKAVAENMLSWTVNN